MPGHIDFLNLFVYAQSSNDLMLTHKFQTLPLAVIQNTVIQRPWANKIGQASFIAVTDWENHHKILLRELM